MMVHPVGPQAEQSDSCERDGTKPPPRRAARPEPTPPVAGFSMYLFAAPTGTVASRLAIHGAIVAALCSAGTTKTVRFLRGATRLMMALPSAAQIERPRLAAEVTASAETSVGAGSLHAAAYNLADRARELKLAAEKHAAAFGVSLEDVLKRSANNLERHTGATANDEVPARVFEDDEDPA